MSFTKYVFHFLFFTTCLNSFRIICTQIECSQLFAQFSGNIGSRCCRVDHYQIHAQVRKNIWNGLMRGQYPDKNILNINPFMPYGISHFYQLDQSICVLRVVG